MSELEQQTEEIEALISIYEGDAFFKQHNSTTFQYKYGDEEDKYSFIVEVSWGEKYPNELPKISLDLYYNDNRNISQTFKSKVVDLLTAEAQNWLDCAMTYTLFEVVKEHLPDLLNDLENDIKNAMVAITENVKAIQLAPVIKTTSDSQEPAKKEQLTKSQKRRMWERTDNKGQKQRGWNWVDIIRHLSQTGQGQKDDYTSPSAIVSQPLAPPPNNY